LAIRCSASSLIGFLPAVVVATTGRLSPERIKSALEILSSDVFNRTACGKQFGYLGISCGEAGG
jgi:hypothetical protein